MEQMNTSEFVREFRAGGLWYSVAGCAVGRSVRPVFR